MYVPLTSISLLTPTVGGRLTYPFASWKHVYQDFVRTTFLGDRKTTIEEYIAENPTIMLELPPAHLVGRYSG